MVWAPWSIKWENFGEHFNSDWDVILVLGNSFCLILDERTREKCIENFMKALKPGGMLVIDQRNFEYMLNNKEKYNKILLKISGIRKIHLLPAIYKGSSIRFW